MVPEALLEEAARRFALLGDPTRLRILGVLQDAGELPVGELALRAHVARENASQHLARLASCGLVARRKHGTTVHYRVSDPALGEICELICAGVREHGARLSTG
ncbi:MAG: metalloregulator ArsR/SmtB family transcription factor [Candidatus Dormibacteraceae bacterium]